MLKVILTAIVSLGMSAAFAEGTDAPAPTGTPAAETPAPTKMEKKAKTGKMKKGDKMDKKEKHSHE